MPRTAIPLATEDVSAFARALARELDAAAPPPGHLQLLNMLARAGGFRNFQHLRAARAAATRLDAPPETVDHALVERALRQFDATGRMLRWPARGAMQRLCLWALWARVPAAVELAEREVNAILRSGHAFDDPATLRRTMIGFGLMTRRRDGSGYRRVETRPPGEARELLRRVAARRAAAPEAEVRPAAR